MQEDGAIDKLDWLRSQRTGFGSIVPEDDFYHGTAGDGRHDVCETWWFEAIVPEQQLVAGFYVALRPNIGVASGGCWIWNGMHRTQSSPAHLDFRIYLPLPSFDGNHIILPEVGLDIEILEPLSRARVTYKSPDGQVDADIEFVGLFSPVLRANGKHFEQALHGKGTLRIGDVVHRVDSYSFRDRSWGEPRPERPLPHPPIGWLCGVLDDGNVAFNLSGTDDPSSAEWSGTYQLTKEQAFYDGWVWERGELRKVVSMTKRTLREPADRMRPLKVEVEFQDETGREYRLRGEPTTGFRMHFWPNQLGWFGYTDWELDGARGYGECQDYLWHDYIRRFATDAEMSV